MSSPVNGSSPFSAYIGAIPAADLSSPTTPHSPSSPATPTFDFKVMIVRAKVHRLAHFPSLLPPPSP